MSRPDPDQRREAREPHDCPERPSSLGHAELGFVRQPMVSWLNPRQLIDTAARAGLSGIFGAYADKREMQALAASEVYDQADAAELWLDYVADLGDGWDPTYTVAALLAADKIELQSDKGTHVTQRGRVLVMGGDQVYPVPKRREYENRFLGPYRAAMPCTHGQQPLLFALPGTHDWYDGLVNFDTVFCRKNWVGGWKTCQSRSYFALELPHRWWLWGVDIQFGNLIDKAQLDYFSHEVAAQVEPGDRIVLCTADAPATTQDNPQGSGGNVDYFERQVVGPTGAEIVLRVTSGLHHYCRYQELGGSSQLITAGGGGAFLHPTHQLPEQLELGAGERRRSYRRVVTYPRMSESKRMRKRLWLLPLRNPAFCALLGIINVLLAFMLSLQLGDAHVDIGVGDLGRALWRSPMAFLLTLLMVMVFAGMVRFAHDAGGLSRLLLGLVHASLQLASLTGVMIVSSRLSAAFGLEGLPSLIVFLALVALVGGFVGAVGLAGYLWVTNCLGFHANETYAPLRVMDFKSFLRLHFDADGNLTVFPIGIDRVCRRWRLSGDPAPEAPWLEPEGDDLKSHLIEAPFRIGP
ncbi:MAG: metallophosphoesterase [Acidimicrobiia bacterium]|nr:metallophosphoesterase [Acidimicrobiia bacterium]